MDTHFNHTHGMTLPFSIIRSLSRSKGDRGMAEAVHALTDEARCFTGRMPFLTPTLLMRAANQVQCVAVQYDVHRTALQRTAFGLTMTVKPFAMERRNAAHRIKQNS